MSKSTNSEWSTPQSLFDKLNAEFGFTVDVCSTHENAKCAKHYTVADDGLNQNWNGEIVWMNPPYGREIAEWMRKAYFASLDGTTVVALVPSRTNAPWWHEYVMRADEIRFIRKKVSFGGRVDGVPFTGSVIVVFNPAMRGPKVSSFTQDGHRGGNGRRRTTPSSEKLGVIGESRTENCGFESRR